MKKVLCILFTAALVSFSLSISALAMDYQHTLKAKNMDVSWTVEGDKLHMTATAKTPGWVAVGFNPESAMKGANIVIGYFSKKKGAKIQDHYGHQRISHKSDKTLGGSDDLVNATVTEEGGMTTISFTIPLDSGDKLDKPLDPSGTTRLLLAYGRGKDSFKQRHRYRSVYDINLSTGKSKKIK